MTAMNEVAARIMEHLVTCPKHGYTWGNRWGDGTTESITIDGKAYSFAGGDRDCSSAIISAYKAAGLNVNATYTGNMKDAFLATGKFEWKPMSFTAQRGDIYLNIQNHTAMCLSAVPDMLGEFCINEFGECYGGKVGDQTGGESRKAAYYNYPWDGILHFKGGNATSGNTSTTTNKTTSSSNNSAVSNKVAPIEYRTAGENKKFYSWCKNCSSPEGDSFGGDVGVPIYYIEMKFPGWYKVKTKNGWLGKNVSGDGNPILAIQCFYETENPAVTGYHSIFYRCSSVNKDWYTWVEDDVSKEGDGYSGDNKPIDRFQAYVGKSTY